MIYQILTPSKLLRPFIQFYWIFESDSKVNICSNSQRIIPNGLIEVMFHYGDRLNEKRDNKLQKQPQVIISGQQTGFYDIIQTGKTAFVAVLFKPHAAKLFFDIPLNKLANQNLDIDHVSKNNAGFIPEQLVAANSQQHKIQIIEHFLFQCLNDKYLYNFDRLTHSIDIIHRNKGLVRVKDLAGDACLSEKQYYRIFLDYVGVSPKQFLKIIRLQNTFYQIQINSTKNLTDLAYLCGYFDQAHFIHDFKSLTGYTPKKCIETGEIYSDYFANG